MILNEKKEKKRKIVGKIRSIRNTTLAAAGVGAVATVSCEWLFHFAIAKKQWELPKFIAKRIDDSGVDHAYEKAADEQEAKLLNRPCEFVEIKSVDGLTLKGRFYQGEKEKKEVFLAVHGFRNRGTREYCFISDFYQKMGVSYLIIDQRACGESEGEYMTYGAKESMDVKLWAEWLAEKCGQDCRIFLHGISLGSATVLLTAGKNLPKQVVGVVADCGYSSAWGEFAHQLSHMGFIPADWVLNAVNILCMKKAKFDIHDASPMQAVKKSDIPHLFIHGTEDVFVPYRMMQEIYDACDTPKWKLSVEGAAHARSYYVDPENYEENVKIFMEMCK